MTPTQTYYSLNAYKIIQALKNRNMEGFYCESKEAALQKILELMPADSLVAFGGSQTLVQAGILDALRAGPYRLIDRDTATTPEERDKLYHDALSSDYFLMSTNAITTDGKLINIDGYGNRIAALIYGPKNVIIVAGMNKVEHNETEALHRVRNLAAPMNSIRLNKQNPCASTGVCHKCTGDGCICCQTLVTRMSTVKNRIKVVLVGESLGY